MKEKTKRAKAKNFLVRCYGLPAKKAGNYTCDVIVDEESKEPFEKRWNKYCSKLVPKRPTIFQKRCSTFLKEIQKRKDDGPIAQHIEIRLISQKVGHGVFTIKRIAKGSIIGFYAGILRYITPRREEEFLHDYYLFGFQGYRELIYFSIDAQKTRNFAAFFNHASATSPLCNIEPLFHFEKDLPRIVFMALRDIKAGEQLCYNYGSAYWKDLGTSPENL